jgi:hypothetical protein
MSQRSKELSLDAGGKRSRSIKCVVARFVKQFLANFRFGPPQICRPLANVTCPLRKRAAASEGIVVPFLFILIFYLIN